MKVWVVIVAGVAGVVLGALVGFASGSDVATTSSIAATGNTIPLPAIGVAGSFEIHPTGLDMEEPGLVAFSFDFVATAPTPEAFRGPRFNPPDAVRLEEVPVVIPAGWTLLTDGGEIAGGEVNPSARRALFAVSEDLSIDEIRGVRLDGYLLGVPYETLVSIPLGGPVAGLVPGVELTAAVSDFRGDWLVEFTVDSEHSIQVASLGVIGLPELGGTQIGGAGTRGWRATYLKDLYPEVPDPLPVLVGGLLWVEIDNQILISVDEL